eukprot:TRINITY_DN9387_c0_g1_i1.p1 TRINITY_DN9387_c0_g1~~TRINITY_DN9387_c0_g1_i1.p1  ORF type:complete len:185 (-),score=37.84 TRINITY_DN9387_c0_g1_i1:29-583(-)
MKKNNKNSSNSNTSSATLYFAIMVGFPGSGKSTISKKMESFSFVRVNQDDLGSSELCKQEIKKNLKAQNNIVLDRCNVHAKDRKMWVNYVDSVVKTEIKKTTINVKYILIHVNTSVEECKKRAKERKIHPTLDVEKADEVIDMFAKGFRPPEVWEIKPKDYTKMYTVETYEEIDDLLKELKNLD